MIHILWLIIKIIGWILLGILGVILGILLFVLFSAICYRVDGKKQGSCLEGRVKVTWFLRILSVTAEYRDGLEIAVKVFGRRIWKMDRTEQEEPGNAHLEEEPENTHPEEESDPAYPKAEPAGSPKVPEGSEALKQDDFTASEEPEATDSNGDRQKGRLLSAIRNAYNRIRSRISSIIAKLKFSIQSICGKLKQAEEKIGWLQEKWEMAQDFIQDPANQKSAKLILRQIGKIFRHIFPRKGTAEITFGLEDPYQMGQLLSAASLLYPFTHNILVLHPVFDEAVLDGEIHIRGRVRIGHLLGYVLRLGFDRNIRRRLWSVIRPSRKQKAKRSRKGKS